MAQLKFKLIYYDIAVQHVNDNTMGTPLLLNLTELSEDYI